MDARGSSEMGKICSAERRGSFADSAWFDADKNGATLLYMSLSDAKLFNYGGSLDGRGLSANSAWLTLCEKCNH